jgi:ABC-type methionine transport system ATPase subunit
MGERSNGIPEELSGGEQQRVSIARALITKPKLILADEPTGALDPITSREILNIFKDLHKNEAVAFLVVTHNREVASFADRSLELRDGRFVAQHGTDVDIGDLTVSREIIIDETGTVTLPPDILAKIGGAGRFELPKLSKDVINLERVESDKIIIEEKGDLVLSPNCPACRYDYGTGTLQMCPECGANRPMIKS